MRAPSPAWRGLLPPAALVLLQLASVLAIIRVDPDDPFSILVAVALPAPLLALAALLAPVAPALLAPFLIMVPGNLLGVTFSHWLLVLALLARLLPAMAVARRWGAPHALEWLWLLYVLWTAVSLTQAMEPRPALEGFVRILTAGLAFLAGHRVLGFRHARALIRVLALVAVAVGLQLVIRIVAGGYSLNLVAERVMAVTDVGWGRSNYIAATASLGAASAIALAFFGGRRERLLGIAGIAAAVLVQVVTLSRGGAVALVAGLLLAGAVEARRRLLPALGIVTAVFALYLLSPLGQATVMRFVGAEGLPSIGVRLIYFREAFAVWREHPLLGAAPNQIPFHTHWYVDPNPHNIFLKHLADLGLGGTLIYLAMLGMVARRASRLRHQARTAPDRMFALALLLTLAVALVNAQYEPTLEGAEYGLLFWMLAGSLAGGRDEAAGRP